MLFNISFHVYRLVIYKIPRNQWIIVQRSSRVAKATRDKIEIVTKAQGKNEGDELRYLALQPCARDVSSAYPSVTAGLARALQPPPFGGGYPEPLLHRRWHPRHSN